MAGPWPVGRLEGRRIGLGPEPEQRGVRRIGQPRPDGSAHRVQVAVRGQPSEHPQLVLAGALEYSRDEPIPRAEQEAQHAGYGVDLVGQNYARDL